MVFFISNREDAIRAYLKSRAKGFARKIYVNAFVSAVRGRDKVSDTSNIAYLLLAMFFITSIYAYYDINELIRSHDATVEKFTELTKEKPDKTPQELESELASIKSSIDSMEGDVDMLRVVNKGIYVGAFVFLYLGLLIWRPYLLMRKRFAHELDKFLSRIQGLASKQELSNIAVLESKVVNEDSLREFINSTRAIAARHNIEQLVATFDLWKS
nr:hypothetical protein [uncultured Desulfuromonas sp.]